MFIVYFGRVLVTPMQWMMVIDSVSVNPQYNSLRNLSVLLFFFLSCFRLLWAVFLFGTLYVVGAMYLSLHKGSYMLIIQPVS